MNTANASRQESRVSPSWHAPPVVFVVDGDVSAREALQSLILRAGWHPEVFACAQEFLYRQRVPTPSCLVLDVTLPDLDGLEVQERLADRIEMPIIFITAHADVPTTVRAMKAGAVEFLTKPFRDEALLRSLENAIELSRAALRHQAEIRPLRDRHASLSPRERQVMGLLVSGQINRQIGAALGISEITVQAHRDKVMRKMEADSLAELVRMAARLRVTPAPTGKYAPPTA